MRRLWNLIGLAVRYPNAGIYSWHLDGTSPIRSTEQRDGSEGGSSSTMMENSRIH